MLILTPCRESNSLRDKGASANMASKKQKQILKGGNGDPWALLNGLGLGAFFFETLDVF